MIFAQSDKEYTILFHKDDHIAKQVLAYMAAEEMPVREIEVSHTHVSGTQWSELASRLGIAIADLINKEHPNYSQKHEKDVDMEDHNWLKFLEHNTETLRAPIVMKGENIRLVEDPQDMLHFDTEH